MNRRITAAAIAVATAVGAAVGILSGGADTLRVTRYPIGRVSGEWSPAYLLWDAIAGLDDRAARHPGPYRIARREPEPVWGPPVRLPEALSRISRQVEHDTYGSIWLLRAKDGVTFRIRKDRKDLRVVDTAGTASVDRVYTAVWDYFHGVSNYGICVCKHISGSASWSQHAHCNALDIGGSPAVLDRVARYLRSDEMTPYVAQLLWRVPNHYTHIHVSGRPLHTGTPTCAY